jgi:hypothetical protein
MRKISGILLFVVLIPGAIAFAAAWTAYEELGRTPGEIIRYAERRLQGHAVLQTMAAPVLGSVRRWLGEPGFGEKPPPFPVPALPPNALGVPHDRLPGVQDRAQTPPASSARRIIRVGAKRNVVSIAMAAGLARDGDIVEIDGGDYYADAAIWDRAELTIRGVGGRARLIAAGAAAEGKAIWVIKRGRVIVENIDFIGARVADRNGAGIRFEQGHLIVRNCLFFDNENGLLATGGDGVLEIENSEFGYNGAGDGQTHNLYAGNLKALKVTGSYFHHANAGHLLKSRAAQNDIVYNRLSDESNGRASYELEFPNGGVARVVGNIIQQTVHGGNSTLVSFGAEGYTWPLNTLHLAHNTLVNDEPAGGAFLRVAPGAQGVTTLNNLLIGRGKFHTPALRQSSGDVRAGWEIFAAAARYDYRLNAAGRRLSAAPGDPAQRGERVPRSEYLHPRQRKVLQGPPHFPGALQSAYPG